MRMGNDSESNAGTAITFLMIGIGIGAGIGLLLAPKTGRQLRKDLRRGYEGMADRVQDFADEARERIDDVVERGSEFADNIRDKAAPLGKAFRR